MNDEITQKFEGWIMNDETLNPNPSHDCREAAEGPCPLQHSSFILHNSKNPSQDCREAAEAPCPLQHSSFTLHNSKKPAPQDLSVRTKDFALRVIRMFMALPKSEEARILGKQVLRSGTSVGANYREANRGRSRAEFIAKIGDCLKELDETAYWLELLEESGIVHPAKLAALRDECNQLLAILTTISKKAKSQS